MKALASFMNECRMVYDITVAVKPLILALFYGQLSLFLYDELLKESIE